EGPSPTKKTPGWAPPKKIIVPNLMPGKLLELKRIAPDIFFIPVRSAEEAAKEASDADSVLGFCTSEIVKVGKKLRWIQVGHAGVEKDLVPELVKSDIAFTNTQRLYGPNVADQAMALLLNLTRGPIQKGPGNWKDLKSVSKADELHGKSMLIVGLGGIGTQIAKRAHAFGMRVMAIDANEALVKPDFVFSLSRPDSMMELLPKSDVVVLAVPLTDKTRGMFGASQFGVMKPTA